VASEPAPGAGSTWVPHEPLPPRDVLRVLGDNTRYAIFLELARAARPLVTAEIAATLGLHPNTVRPHLDRMREVGLLDVTTDARGEVGRPQHRYSTIAEAPSLTSRAERQGDPSLPPPCRDCGAGSTGSCRSERANLSATAQSLEPSTIPVLARMVLNMAERLQAGPADAAAVGETEGAARAAGYAAAPSTLEALVADLDRLGFDPVASEGTTPDAVVVAFANCPFAPYAASHPDLVCNLHRGLVSGFVEAMGDAEVVEFCSFAHRTPCQVEIAARIPS